MKWEDILKISFSEARNLGYEYAPTDMDRGRDEASRKKDMEATKKVQEQYRTKYRKIQAIFKKYTKELFRSDEKRIREVMDELNEFMSAESLTENERERIGPIVSSFVRYFRKKGIDFETGKTRFEVEG